MAEGNHHKLIIIGSGPAGLTAAIYAARAELKPLVLAGVTYGGQLMTTSDVGNFPGFVEDIQGPELMQRMLDQAKRFGAEILMEDVTKVDFSKQPFKLWVSEKEFSADAVIIATGASAMWLGLESEQKFRGRGVSSCATCDGFFFKDKKVYVVGAGDTALEEATFLTKFASEVIMLVRKGELKGSKIMQRRAENDPKISVMFNSEVEEVLGNEQVTGLKIKNNQTNEVQEVEAQGLFVAIGHKPNTEFLQNSGVELDVKGYIVPKERSFTGVEGVFVSGDVHDHIYRQAVTAAGAGCMAAMDAERWLAERSEK